MYNNLCRPPIAISIHALRVEGDDIRKPVLGVVGISIHALRVEGDPAHCLCA